MSSTEVVIGLGPLIDTAGHYCLSVIPESEYLNGFSTTKPLSLNYVVPTDTTLYLGKLPVHSSAVTLRDTGGHELSYTMQADHWAHAATHAGLFECKRLTLGEARRIQDAFDALGYRATAEALEKVLDWALDIEEDEGCLVWFIVTPGD